MRRTQSQSRKKRERKSTLLPNKKIREKHTLKKTTKMPLSYILLPPAQGLYADIKVYQASLNENAPEASLSTKSQPIPNVKLMIAKSRQNPP